MFISKSQNPSDLKMVSTTTAWIVTGILVFLGLLLLVFIYYYEFVYEPEQQIQQTVSSGNLQFLPGFPATDTSG
jgi:hypothetical protein